MHQNQEPLKALSIEDLADVSGGVAPVAIALAVYTFFGPFVAAGAAIGVAEAVENNQE